MNWKTDLRLGDLGPNAILEATCKRCGRSRLRPAHELQQPAHNQLYLDELEKRLICRNHRCQGPMRLSLEEQHLIEGFTGGMP